jgi:hypothetical protein
MKTRMKTAISLLGVFQLGILALLLVSFDTFVNFETAFFSALLVILGSIYSYRSLVMKRVASAEASYPEDAIDRIEDPFDLYDDEVNGEAKEGVSEEVDLKAVIKEEKKRLKSSKRSVENVKQSAPAMISVYRLVPYGILALGFVALKNNGILSLWPYLMGLALGILGGLLVARSLFIKKD